MDFKKETDINKKTKRLNFLKGRQPRIPSQTFGAANIQINLETAIPGLKKLVQEYVGCSDPHGFLTNVRNTLGFPNSKGASKYGEVVVQ